MSRVPYFNFYPSDFMNGVRGLTAQEVGVYTMLLCRIYEESGPVEYHVLRLATYCGMREKTFAKTVEKLVDLGKMTLIDGRLSNRRSEAEIQKRSDGLEIASRAGKASAEKRQQKQEAKPTPVERPFNHTDTDTDKSSEANASDGDAVDFAKAIFENGVRFLCQHGSKEPHARSVIGKWRKDHHDREIFDAFVAAKREGVTDPIPWITKKLKPDKPFSVSFDLSKFEGMQ